jgi:predicted nucleotidyltransferase
MSKQRQVTAAPREQRWYRGAEVPQAAIRRFAQQVAERFQPEKIILFGSYAYGTPHADSDVDILVVMPCRNELDQAVKICLAIDRRFALDLIVRTPKDLKARLEDGDLFHTHIVTNGKVLYEKGDAGVDRKSRGGSAGRRVLSRKQ